MMRAARKHGGSDTILALCIRVAYLTVSRPDEMRWLMRHGVTSNGIRVSVGKRKGGQAEKHKLIEWSPALRAAVEEAIAIQRTTSIYLFGNSDGQPCTTSGFDTMLRRLMVRCATLAEEEGVELTRFTLSDTRPAAVTDRMEHGDERITNATGHNSERMVKQAYDRRKTKSARATSNVTVTGSYC